MLEPRRKGGAKGAATPPSAAVPTPQQAAAAVRQTLLASIDLFSEDIVLSRYERGSVERQYIDADQILAILSKVKGREEKDRAMLPVWPGVIAAGVDGRGQGRWIVLRPAGPATYQVTVAGKVRTVRLRRCPALVAELHGKVEHGAVRWIGLERVVAVAGDGAKPPSAGERVHLAPFGDVDSDGGMHLCGVQWNLTAGMDAPAALDAVLLRSRFTGASLDVALSAAGRRRYRNVLELATAKRLDLAMLKEVGTYAKTFH